MVSLRLADTFGFDALYMTGFGTVASHLGLPDAGIAADTEMVRRVRLMASMARAPLIATATPVPEADLHRPPHPLAHAAATRTPACSHKGFDIAIRLEFETCD